MELAVDLQFVRRVGPRGADLQLQHQEQGRGEAEQGRNADHDAIMRSLAPASNRVTEMSLGRE